MHANYNILGFFLVLFLLCLTASESKAELLIENPEKLSFLIDGMEAVRNKVVTTRATIHSVEVYDKPGEPLCEIYNKTTWVSDGIRFKYETDLTQLFDGKLPEKGKPGQKHVPIGKRFYQHAYNGEVLCTYIPSNRKAILRNLEGSPIDTLSASVKQRPLFTGLSIMGLSLKDIVAGKSWHPRPEDRGLPAKRVVKWAGTRDYKGRKLHVIEMTADWVEVNGFPKTRRYEILVDSERGFTIPFISVESKFRGVHSKFDTIETKCIEYDKGIWAPHKTVRTLLFMTAKGEGRSVTTITVDQLKFNTPISDEELKIKLPYGTSVDDLIVGVYYKFGGRCTLGVGNEELLLKSIKESFQEAGFKRPLPIERQAQKKQQKVVSVVKIAYGFGILILIVLLICSVKLGSRFFKTPMQ